MVVLEDLGPVTKCRIGGVEVPADGVQVAVRRADETQVRARLWKLCDVGREQRSFPGTEIERAPRWREPLDHVERFEPPESAAHGVELVVAGARERQTLPRVGRHRLDLAPEVARRAVLLDIVMTDA